MSDQNEHGIGHFAALKTAIVNGEEESVQELLAEHPMQQLEKDYLIDLANLNNNPNILKMLKNTPVNK